MTLPNPLTPLAWLPPEIASQVEVARYLFSAVIGVRRVPIYKSSADPQPRKAWLWDVLMAVRDETQIVKKHRLAFPDIAYVLARWVTSLYIPQIMSLM